MIISISSENIIVILVVGVPLIIWFIIMMSFIYDLASKVDKEFFKIENELSDYNNRHKFNKWEFL